jgi:hypothetical protein
MVGETTSIITNRDANRHGSAMEVRAPEPSEFRVTEKPSVSIKPRGVAEGLHHETDRLTKLENIKEFVQFKKIAEYESETIELYDMLSSEFDYEELRM